MSVKRIVSFLPSATELLYEFEVQDDLYGVTHECKYPKDAISKPHVINSVINSDELTSKEIDTMTCQLLNDGEDIFVLNDKEDNILTLENASSPFKSSFEFPGSAYPNF